MSSSDDKIEFSTVSQPKPKAPISALEKYGYLDPSKLLDDDYDDDDYVDDDYDEDADEIIDEKIPNTQVSTAALTEAETTEGGNTAQGSPLTSEEEEGDQNYEDDETYFIEDDLSGAGDWRVVTVHGSEDFDSEEEEEEEEEEEMQTRRQKRLSTIRHKKDTLIYGYLTIMKHLGRLKRQNMYLEDYLYKLCFRMQLIKDPSELEKTMAENQKSVAKLKRQKKKLNAKMAANYEAFVNAKLPLPVQPEIKPRGVPTRGQLTRARRVVKDNKRPPNYSTKLDPKILNINGVKYQRLLRSASRNWPENVEDDDTKYAMEELKRKEAEGKGNPRKEVPRGLSRAPKRLLIEVIQPPKNKKSERQGKLKKERTGGGEQITNNSRPVCKKNCDKRNKSKSGNQKSTRSNSRKSEKAEKKQKKKHGADAVLVPKNRPSRKKSKFDPKTLVGRPVFGIRKRNCRKKRRFRPYQWFDNGKLKGRQVSGTKLHPAEKEHLVNFVNSAVLNNSSRRKAKKTEKQRHLSKNDEWNAACKRLFQLIIKQEESEKQHAKEMQRKLIDWGMWEKRNSLGVEGLLNLFRTFVQQPHYTKRELKKFIPDITEFEQILHSSHAKLMEQVVKLYKTKLSLMLVQRRLKDKADQTLNQQGLSIAYLEQLSVENHTLYEKIQERERNLVKQGEKLRTTMKRMLSTRNKKGSLKTKVHDAHGKVETILGHCANKRKKALEVMDKYSEIMKKHEAILLQATLVERPYLLHDFRTRKSCLEHLDAHKRRLKRQLYLCERELTLTHVKMKNTRRDIRQFKETTSTNRTVNELRIHKSAINGKINNFIATAIDKCANDSIRKPKQPSASVPGKKTVAWK